MNFKENLQLLVPPGSLVELNMSYLPELNATLCTNNEKDDLVMFDYSSKVAYSDIWVPGKIITYLDDAISTDKFFVLFQPSVKHDRLLYLHMLKSTESKTIRFLKLSEVV